MRQARWLILVAVGAAWAVSTAARVHVWSDERLLWMEAVRLAPEKPRAWVNLGRQYQLHGAGHLAEDAYLTAIALSERPGRHVDEQRAGRAFAEANLALALAQRGETNRAQHLITQAVNRVPYDPVIGATAAWIAASK